NPLVNKAMSPLMAYVSPLSSEPLYQFPYPFHVTAAAYITFAEAVLGAALVTILIWNRLPGRRWPRLLILAVLVAALKGVVGGTIVYAFFTGPSWWVGLLSWSQFLLEFLALGLLVGLAWDIYGQPRN